MFEKIVNPALEWHASTLGKPLKWHICRRLYGVGTYLYLASADVALTRSRTLVVTAESLHVNCRVAEQNYYQGRLLLDEEAEYNVVQHKPVYSLTLIGLPRMMSI